jgi:hypothetical protein
VVRACHEQTDSGHDPSGCAQVEDGDHQEGIERGDGPADAGRMLRAHAARHSMKPPSATKPVKTSRVVASSRLHSAVTARARNTTIATRDQK